MDNIYAIESYDPDINTYARYDIGDKSNMIDQLVDKVNSGLNDNKYYRVIPISEKDTLTWRKQVDSLPDIRATDYIFGEWIQMSTAAKYLGLSFGRVFNLVSGGEIRVQTTEGRNKLVNVEDIVERKINPPRIGRPPKTPATE